MKPTIREAVNPAWWLAFAAHRLRVWLLSPTRSFPSRQIDSLLFDLPSAALCGIPFESPISALTPLGRANWFFRTRADYTLLYYALGAEVSILQGGFDSFRLFFRPSEGVYGRAHAFQPAAVDLRIAPGRRLAVSADVTETQLIELLGRPTSRRMQGDLSRCSFELEGVTFEAYSNPSTLTLNELAVYAPESMSARTAA